MRLVAATNVDLASAVSAGRFRLDLYYRLNVINFELPPLRRRRGDILPLADYFLKLYSRKLQIDPPTLLPDAAQLLVNYSWPGNIRELENVIHFALLIATEGVIRADNLRFAAMPTTLGNSQTKPIQTPYEVIGAQLDRLFRAPPEELYETLEALIVRRAFVHSGHNQVQTAKLLGISRNILRTLLGRFELLGKRSTHGDILDDTLGDTLGGPLEPSLTP